MPDGSTERANRGLLCVIACVFCIGIVCSTVILIVVDGTTSAIALAGLGGMITSAVGFLLTNFKQQTVESKIDAGISKVEENTALTLETQKEIKEVKIEASQAVITAADATISNTLAVANIARSLNGGFDERITACVKAGLAGYEERMVALELHDKRNTEHLASLVLALETLAKERQ